MSADKILNCIVLRNKGGTMPADEILKSVVLRYMCGTMPAAIPIKLCSSEVYGWNNASCYTD